MIFKLGLATFLLLCSCLLAQRQCEVPAPLPLRYDEDYRDLGDPACRSDPIDRIKYIPIGRSDGRYISIGGEIRERYDF